MIIQSVLLVSNTRGILLQYPPEFPKENYCIKSIHKLCFPETSIQIFNYFSIPSTKSQTPLYGAIVFSHQSPNYYIIKPDNPTENEIIGICILTHSPYLHIIKNHLKPLADLYFNQNNFINERLLMSIYKTLNVSFKDLDFTLPNCCSLINRLGYNFLSVLKMFLLDTKICINNSNSSEITSQWIFSLLSFLPGCLFPVPDSMKQVKWNGHLKRCLFHCTLSELDLLSSINVFGCTSSFFTEIQGFDVTIGEKDVFLSSKYKSIYQLSKADKQLTSTLLQCSKINDFEKCYKIILHYITGLFYVSKLKKKGLLSPPEYEDYGSSFISEFKKTALFQQLPEHFDFTCTHPINYLNQSNKKCEIDFSQYIHSNNIDVESEPSIYFPSYH